MTMVVERPDPGDTARCAAARESGRRVLAAWRNGPFEPDSAAMLLQVRAEQAGWDSLLGAPPREIREGIASGAACGIAAGIAAARHGAAVQLATVGVQSAFIASGHAGMHPQRWCLAFSLAAVTGADPGLGWLTRADIVQACQRPAGQADGFWPPFCLALAEISGGAPGRAALQAAMAATEPGAFAIAEPDYVETTRRPLMALAALLRDGVGSAEWSLGVAAALAAHRDYYAGERRFEPLGLVAFEILGLCALARRRGIATDVSSPYLPLDWLQIDWPPIRVRLDYPVQHVADALEGRWVVDRHGYARAGRAQSLEQGADGLIMRVSAPGDASLPPAQFGFLEAPARAGGPGLLALAPGEAIGLAEDLAARGLHGEALAALRRVLAEMPEDGARRPALLARQAALQAPPARPDAAPDAEIAAAMQAAGAVQEIARPLLEAIFRGDPAAGMRALRPREEDYALVFTPAMQAPARAVFEAFWQTPPPLRAPGPAQTRLRVFAAPAGILRDDHPLSRPFSAQYRRLAPALNPHLVWLTWRITAPGETSGLTYDGLVWCGDHFSWFPQPFRILPAG
jgi:hypothetical protein